MLTNARDNGILILGHGTRSAAGVDAFHDTVRIVREKFSSAMVEPAFMELAKPDFDTSIERMVAAGVRSIRVVPMLLLAAGHAKVDIPALIGAAAKRHPAVQVSCASVLGRHGRILELSRMRFEECVADRSDEAMRNTLLVFVGRGARDPEANAELARFARLRWEQTPCGWLEICYLAMTRPTLSEALEHAASSSLGRIVVQPHLLFPGDLLSSMYDAVELTGRKYSEKEWISGPCLGPHELLAEEIVETARAYDA